MHSAKTLGSAALVLLVILHPVAGASLNGSVAVPFKKGEESTEGPFFSAEQATDVDFLIQTDDASLNAKDSEAGSPKNGLKRKLETLSNDMLTFIQDLSEINMNRKKTWDKLAKSENSKVSDVNGLQFRLHKIVEKCVEKFGVKCVEIMSAYESDGRKREAKKSPRQYAAQSVPNMKNVEKIFFLNQQDPSDVSINTEETHVKGNESITQFVFRELQNLLYNSRSDLQDESKEVKLVAGGYLDNPVYSDFVTDTNPADTNSNEFRKTTPNVKLTTQPARLNSVSTPEILLSKFHSSSPKNLLSEFYPQKTTLPSTTESGINYATSTSSRYQSTQSTGRYPRSTTSQGSVIQRNKEYYFRTPPTVYPVQDVTQGYDDYIVDYITADYDTTNPRLTLKKILSQGGVRDRLPENVQYEIVNSYPESYDDSDFPMYEYFVISEQSEDEPSYLPSPNYQGQKYTPPEKTIFEEPRVPVQLVTGNRVSTASSTRYISTTPLSNDELYQIIKERIPLSTDQPQTFTTREIPIKTFQQAPSKLLTESQIITPSNFASSPTSSYAFKSTITEGTTKPLIVNIQEETGNTIRPSLQPEETTKFSTAFPEKNKKPLVVGIQEPDDETTLSNLPTEPTQSFETTTLDSTVETNSFTASNLPTTNDPVVTKPITESTTAGRDVGLTTTLQDLITAIEDQLGSTAGAVEEPVPLRTEIPMQVTVTSDEITVTGPDTQSISTILYELRQPLLSTPTPFASYVRPHVDFLKPVEVDPLQFAEFTSNAKKPSKKPSITSLFSGDSSFVRSSIPAKFQSIPINVYRTSGSVQPQEPTLVNDEPQEQVSNSYGIPEYLIKSELLGDESKPGVTATHIFGIPKEIIESELNDDPEENELEAVLVTSTTTDDKNPVNLVEQLSVQKLEDGLGDDLPFNGIPLSMLNAELRRTHPDGGYDLNFERDTTDAVQTPTSTFYVVDDEPRSSTVPFLTTEKIDGSFLTNFMSIFSQS